MRLDGYKYVEYETGDRELYDLQRDPYELRNRFTDPRYRRVRAFLRRQLRRLEDCHGQAVPVHHRAAAAAAPRSPSCRPAG